MKFCDCCGGVAGDRKKFRDPRREKGKERVYVELYFCSKECELGIIEDLERQAQIARLVH